MKGRDKGLKEVEMKRCIPGVLISLIILVIWTFLILAGGCHKACPCPKENVYFMLSTPDGHVPVRMRKGFYDDPENFITEKQYEKERLKRQQQEVRGKWQIKYH